MEIDTLVSYSDRFVEGLEYAAREHRAQGRKGRAVPFIGHLLGVASLVIDSGGTEDEAIAALLHDVAEDQGGYQALEKVRRCFGPRVADIVEACSDSLVADPSQKAPWRERKATYIEHLRGSDDVSVYLISAADKLHNTRSMLAAHRRVGESLWADFKGKKDGTFWNLNTLLAVYESGPPDERRREIVRDLRQVLTTLEAESAAASGART